MTYRPVVALRTLPAFPPVRPVRSVTVVLGELAAVRGLTNRPVPAPRDLEPAIRRTAMAPKVPTEIIGGQPGGADVNLDGRATVSGVGQMYTSAQMVPAMLAAARPQAWWQPQEWDELLTDRLGALGDRDGRLPRRGLVPHPALQTRLSRGRGVDSP